MGVLEGHDDVDLLLAGRYHTIVERQMSRLFDLTIASWASHVGTNRRLHRRLHPLHRSDASAHDQCRPLL